jgi:hypothetical protein
MVRLLRRAGPFLLLFPDGRHLHGIGHLDHRQYYRPGALGRLHRGTDVADCSIHAQACSGGRKGLWPRCPVQVLDGLPFLVIASPMGDEHGVTGFWKTSDAGRLSRP